MCLTPLGLSEFICKTGIRAVGTRQNFGKTQRIHMKCSEQRRPKGSINMSDQSPLCPSPLLRPPRSPLPLDQHTAASELCPLWTSTQQRLNCARSGRPEKRTSGLARASLSHVLPLCRVKGTLGVSSTHMPGCPDVRAPRQNPCSCQMTTPTRDLLLGSPLRLECSSPFHRGQIQPHPPMGAQIICHILREALHASPLCGQP